MTSWYGGINSYFGSLVLWKILSTNNETTSILYRPNEMQKLDVAYLWKQSLFTKMIAYTTSYATTSPVALGEKSRESRSRNFQADSYKCRKDCGCSKVPFSILPQNVSKVEEKLQKNSPKWAKVALRGKNCTLARKRESCAKVVLRNIAIFWGD